MNKWNNGYPSSETMPIGKPMAMLEKIFSLGVQMATESRE